ncbi:hypothetical protein EI42_03474 [Thermosporothrix hazakensis]|uniref:Uncharacterized protein n=1 Tax=Thermosporothrix hazakensis TaxID=644383 RepID=A0A326U5Y6_THEHA|nr:hypothetical protein EI42_03474 [Thermosporothrix hazakensis]
MLVPSDRRKPVYGYTLPCQTLLDTWLFLCYLADGRYGREVKNPPLFIHQAECEN